MQEGIIFNFQRFSVHDGPGIRTNIFFKGCPLHCAWCHNPEGLSDHPEISYLAHRCIGCGACVSACTYGVHSFRDTAHEIDRTRCVGCGACEMACAYGALELQGKRYTIEETVSIAKRDLLFYGEKGGVTLTGGEPMMQPEFAVALAKQLHSEGIGVCVETSGFANRFGYEQILPYIDRFLFDIKETDEENHKRYTGVGMETIRENLQCLDANGANIVLRCPMIPDVNFREDHFRKISELAERMQHVCEIDLVPYHPLGMRKGERIGKVMPYQRKDPLEWEALETCQQAMTTWTKTPVVIL